MENIFLPYHFLIDKLKLHFLQGDVNNVVIRFFHQGEKGWHTGTNNLFTTRFLVDSSHTHKFYSF